jgi:hypothetical protein
MIEKGRMKRSQNQELLMTLQVTASEVTAMNVAVGFFRSYAGEMFTQYNLISQLLEQYQRRLHEQIVPEKVEDVPW